MLGDKPDGTRNTHRVEGKDILLDTGAYTESNAMSDITAESHTSSMQWIIGCTEK